MPDRPIPGAGADLEPSSRPGIPMETQAQPLAGARTPIEPQHSEVPVFKHAGRKQMPPVYGTAQPPKGLSGLLRKTAYSYPDHWARHWMVLLLADRVDVWEHRLRRSLPGGPAAVATLLVGRLTLRRLSRA